MTLDKLPKGESATITGIHASRELKNRFNSFGLVKGARIRVEERSLGKKTIRVRINKTRIALRAAEAEHIKVKQ